jgi:hypothetical protein
LRSGGSRGSASASNWRTSKFDHSDEPVMLRIVVLASGQFAGLGLNPANAAPPIDP